MGLNVKLALLTCLLCTGGTCWLVNEVARPVLNLPTPPVAERRESTPLTAPTASPATAAGALAHESPVAVAAKRDATSGGDAVLVRDVSVSPVAERDTLPPVHVPSEAELASARGHARPETDASRDESLNPSRSASGLLSARTGVDSAAVSHAPETSPQAPTGPEAPTPYVVQRGDFLAKICRKNFGSDDGSVVRAVLDANPQLKSRPDLLLAGKTIMLPVIRAGGPTTGAGAAASGAGGSGAVGGVKPAGTKAREPARTAVVKPGERKPVASNAKPADKATKPSPATVSKASSAKSSATGKAVAAKSGSKSAGASSKKPASANLARGPSNPPKSKTQKPG